VQKPISPFVEEIGNDAMATEIDIVKSKAIALRVASELQLDRNPEFQPRNLTAELMKWMGLPGLSRFFESKAQSTGDPEEDRAQILDQVADALLESLQVSYDAYVISITTTSESPTMARRLASTIAQDYLASQREARQEALQRVAAWLKDRADSMKSRVLESQEAISRLQAENDLRDNDLNNLGEQAVGEIVVQLARVRAEVDEKRARLDQVRSVVDNHGDVQGIAELTASPTLAALRQRQVGLSERVAELRPRLGAGNLQVTLVRAELDAVDQQIATETDHILGNIKNSYDIAVRQEQSLEASLRKVHENAQARVKL
jgi:polysaccharide biosynthesis transport protein